MRFKTAALSTLFVLLASAFGASAQQSDTPATPLPPWNDNSLIKVQRNDEDPTRSGDVKIEFYGHNAVKITSPAVLPFLPIPGATIQPAFTQSGS